MTHAKHRCSKCGTSFDPYAHRTKDVSAASILYRKNQALPLGDDIQQIELVHCPACGHIEKAAELKVFGFIPAARTTTVLVALLIVIVAFGAWLLHS